MPLRFASSCRRDLGSKDLCRNLPCPYDTLYDEKIFFADGGYHVKRDKGAFDSYDMKGVPYNVFFSKTEIR